MNRPVTKYLFLAVLFLAFMSCTDRKKNVKGLPYDIYSAEIVLSDSVFNLGNIAERDEPYTCVFTFRNTGKVPAVILHAVSSCKCTSVTYGKEPVAVGSTDSITVQFDSKESGKGFFNKSVKIRVNSMKQYSVKIKGVVQ